MLLEQSNGFSPDWKSVEQPEIKYILIFFICSVKKISKIDKQLPRHFEYYGEILNLPPFLCIQIIIPYVNSVMSTNYEKGFANYGTLIPLFFL